MGRFIAVSPGSWTVASKLGLVSKATAENVENGGMVPSMLGL